MKIKSFFCKYKKEIIILSFIVAITFLLMLTFRYGNDFFWHMKSGEVMVKNHTILKTDVFSWYLKSFHPVWISHEWLFEVILYSSSFLFGKYTGYFCTFLGIFLLLFVLYMTNRDDFHKNIYFTIFWLCSSIVLTMNTLPRPFLISNLFLALTFTLLYDLKKNSSSKKIYLLPILAFLWSNIHGGSSNLSYILIFVFYFCGLFDFSFGKIESSAFTREQRRKYIVVFFLTILAICINPHGIEMLGYPYQNMGDAFMLATISEWQPTNFNDSSSLLYIFLILSLFIPIVINKHKVELVDLMIIVMFTFLGLKSLRFWPIVFIAFTYVVFHYVTSCKYQLRLFENVLIVSTFVIVGVSLFIYKLPSEEVIDYDFIKILKEEKPKRLYNLYDYGGYLIYNDIFVFIDSRADLYAQYNYQDNYNLSMLRGPFEEILDKYNFDYFLLDKGYPLSYYLSKKEDYEVVLEKGNVILYAKKEGR